MTLHHDRRLRRLESTVSRTTCPRCHNHPVRLAYIDPATNAEWHAEMPESGCPECGRAPVNEIHIIVEPSEGATPATML